MASRDHADHAADRWLVDGFNVLHVGLLHGRQRGRWWSGDARAQLLSRIKAFESPGRLCVVFDGPDPGPGDERPGGSETRSIEIVFAPSADEWLLREVKKATPAERVTLVTADRKLADRARHRGAEIVSPKAFLALCPPPETPPAAP